MKRKPRTTPHLFAQWDDIAERIRGKKRLVVFLDFDGTLVRIAPTPNSVRLDEGTRNVLQKLSSNRHVTVAIISGRQRAELQKLIGIRKMKYMGLYGWESKGNQRVPFPVREDLVRALVRLLSGTSRLPRRMDRTKAQQFFRAPAGRQRRNAAANARTISKKHVQPMRETLKVMANIRDLEVAPVSLGDKGVAVRKFLG